MGLGTGRSAVAAQDQLKEVLIGEPITHHPSFIITPPEPPSAPDTKAKKRFPGGRKVVRQQRKSFIIDTCIFPKP